MQLVRRVSKPQCERSVRFLPVIPMPVRSAPPTTFCFVLTRFTDASYDAPSQRNITRAVASRWVPPSRSAAAEEDEVSSLDVLFFFHFFMQFNASFLTHAKRQTNALKILSELFTPHGGTKKGRKTFASQAHHGHQSFRKKLASSTKLNGARRPRSFSFILSPQPSPILTQPVHGERKAFLAVTKGLVGLSLSMASGHPPQQVLFPARPPPRGTNQLPTVITSMPADLSIVLFVLMCQVFAVHRTERHPGRAGRR